MPRPDLSESERAKEFSPKHNFRIASIMPAHSPSLLTSRRLECSRYLQVERVTRVCGFAHRRSINPPL
jgi:hypothetical protein